MLHVAELLRLADQDSLLLVPNLRAARRLQRQLADSPEASSHLGSLVLHWRGWTAQLWQRLLVEGVDDRVLLEPLQERLLWEQLLQDEGHREPASALIDLCLSAAALTYRHAAEGALLSAAVPDRDPDAAHFSRWFRRMTRHCEEQRLLPGAALESALRAGIGRLETPVAASVLWCGTGALLPAQDNLLRAVAAAGVAVRTASPQHHAPPSDPTPAAPAEPPVLLRCADVAAEWQVLAQHLASLLRGPRRPEVAVVVPDLSNARNRIERTLRAAIPTGTRDTFTEDRRPLWEFSTGHPLPSVPAVTHALLLLRWTTAPLPAADVSVLLRSAALDFGIAGEDAAALDAVLLRRNPNTLATWTPQAVSRTVASQRPALADVLTERTAGWASLRGSTAAFGTHVEQVRKLLRLFGFPGSRQAQGSVEYQAVRRWEHLLDSLAGLDLVAPAEPWPAFLGRLEQAARATSFAPENTGAPIQFLTPEESSGIATAELWVAHTDEGRWSSRATLHPLLTRRLQTDFGMPGADPALDQARFVDSLHALLATAPSVTFSYAHAGESGEQRPNPFLAALPNLTLREGAEHSSGGSILPALHADAAGELESFADGDLLPVPLVDGLASLRGGVSVLQSQAACAFRAFVERRLGSTTLEERDLGFDARERGTLLHGALQAFWTEVRDRKTLASLIEEGRLAQQVHRAVAHTLRQDDSSAWAVAYREVQQQRLESLLDRWLRMEAGRPDFRVVALEQSAHVTVGPLALDVRVDRIDEVETESGPVRIVLDYKTGDPSAKMWSGDRPEEPQLPLYATAALESAGAPPVGAIAFAVVRAGDKLNFRSLPGKSALLYRDSKSTEALGEALTQWSGTLQSLAEDFAAGIATVGPKEYPATCRFCEQRMLCRLNPDLLDDDEGAAEA